MFLEESWAFGKSACSSAMEVDMPEVERYETLVIGSGEAGKQLTWNLAQAGHRTAVVERKYIGGSCPNIACLPSKNVIRSAKANWFARHGTEYGIQTGPVSTDMRGVLVSSRSLQGYRSGADQGRSPVRGSEDG
jgi:pyruvate/2-oxoglutarate dehydrogenase complex dihydrolipoamide dehydrogenase (E3) component